MFYLFYPQEDPVFYLLVLTKCYPNHNSVIDNRQQYIRQNNRQFKKLSIYNLV